MNESDLVEVLADWPQPCTVGEPRVQAGGVRSASLISRQTTRLSWWSLGVPSAHLRAPQRGGAAWTSPVSPGLAVFFGPSHYQLVAPCRVGTGESVQLRHDAGSYMKKKEHYVFTFQDATPRMPGDDRSAFPAKDSRSLRRRLWRMRRLVVRWRAFNVGRKAVREPARQKRSAKTVETSQPVSVQCGQASNVGSLSKGLPFRSAAIFGRATTDNQKITGCPGSTSWIVSFGATAERRASGGRRRVSWTACDVCRVGGGAGRDRGWLDRGGLY